MRRALRELPGPLYPADDQVCTPLPPPQSCPEVQELQGLGILGRSAQPPAVVSLVSTLQQADPGQPHGEPHPHPATAHPRCRDGEAHQDEG